MKVLVDTDVILDVELNRRPHARTSGQLLDHLQRSPGTGFVAWHTISIVCYLTSGTRSATDPRSFLAALSTFLTVAPASTDSLRWALNLDLADFENAMQVAAALACGADVVATRNLKDFARSPLPAASPAALLDQLAL